LKIQIDYVVKEIDQKINEISENINSDFCSKYFECVQDNGEIDYIKAEKYFEEIFTNHSCGLKTLFILKSQLLIKEVLKSLGFKKKEENTNDNK